MALLWIAGIAVILLLAVIVIAFICYRMAFYQENRNPVPEDVIRVPQGKIYEPYREAITNWTLQTRAMPREDMYITSFDGLKLHGRYYEYAPDAPMELMFHGYRSSAEQDLSGGVQRCFSLGHSALIVDQRCSGESQGNVITFGIYEHRDCLSWVDYILTRFGSNVQIILTGISMGAATVLTAAGKPLPENVIGVLADCGYDSAKNIIREVIRQMKLPPRLAYPFVKLGAKLFGHFDLEETSPLEAMKTCTVPVLLFHGDADSFVPCQMSQNIYDACTSKKRLVIVPGAGHGLSFPADPELYRQAMQEFFSACQKNVSS